MRNLKCAIAILALAGIRVPGGRGGGVSAARSRPPAGTITLKAKPVKIISLSPSTTEDLFAIGAGTQVRAVDDQSSFPVSAPRTKLSGFTPNVEAIAEVQARPRDHLERQRRQAREAPASALKIPVMMMPAALKLERRLRADQPARPGDRPPAEGESGRRAA